MQGGAFWDRDGSRGKGQTGVKKGRAPVLLSPGVSGRSSGASKYADAPDAALEMLTWDRERCATSSEPIRACSISAFSFAVELLLPCRQPSQLSMVALTYVNEQAYTTAERGASSCRGSDDFPLLPEEFFRLTMTQSGGFVVSQKP